ncbi:hypothetical protein H8D04_00765 [bacterium]|nr:hypothetical protein [bacterium]
MADSLKTNRENLKLIKELIKEQAKYLKGLERGSTEYKAANTEMKKLRTQLVQVNKEFNKGKDIRDKHADIQDRQYKRALEIRSLNVILTKQAKKQASYAQTVESLGNKAGENLKKAVSLQNNMTSGGDIASKHYGMTSLKLAEVGGHFEGIGDMQDKATDLSLQMAKNYDDIGTNAFDLSMMKSEIQDLGDKAATEREVIESMIHTVKDQGLKDSLKAELKVLDDVIDGLTSKEKALTRVDKLTKIAATELTAPFEKLKSIIEGMPFGGFISEHMKLTDVVDNFGKMSRKSLAAAFDPTNPMTMQMALKNIGIQGVKAVEGLVDGFKATNALLGGMLGPILLVAAALIAVKKIVDIFYGGMLDTRKELGLTVAEAGKLQSSINTTALEFSLLGVSAEDVKGISDSIRDNMGGMASATHENISAMTQLSALYGISGENTGVLATQMMAVGASSFDTATSQMESVALLARANGVAPAAIMNDVAGASEAFAGFAKDGGENIFKAAIAARKLGLDMGAVEKIADSLLDFESSINAQMEASMLIGRNINTDKARELALNGDLEGMQKEITKQIGSAADYERLNVVQRKSLAAAFGVSVSELSKMVTNQDKLNNLTEGEKAHRDMIAKVMEIIGKAWAGFLSISKALLPIVAGIAAALLVVFWPITAAVSAITLLGMGFNKLNKHFPKLSAFLGVILGLMTAIWMKSKLAGKEMTGGMMKGAKNMAMGLKERLMGMGGGGITEKATGSGMSSKKGAGGVLGKGLKSTGKGISAFGKSVATLANPATLIGLAAITLAVIGLGYGFKLLGEGLGKAAPAIKAFMEGVGSIIKDVGAAIVDIMDGITTNVIRLSAIPFANLFKLGIGLASLGTGLGLMAIGALALIPALPVLFVLNKMGLLGGVSLGGGEEKTVSKEEGNPVEIKLTETNAKLDNLIELMGESGVMAENLIGIKKNTGTFAGAIV